MKARKNKRDKSGDEEKPFLKPVPKRNSRENFEDKQNIWNIILENSKTNKINLEYVKIVV